MTNENPHHPPIQEIASGELKIWLDESAGCIVISSAAAPGFPVELFEQDVVDLVTTLQLLASKLRGERES